MRLTAGQDRKGRTVTRTVGAGAAVTRRLIRKETRGDLPLLACLAVVVLGLTALCAWVPAFAGGQEDQALRRRVDASQAQAPLISLSTTPEVFDTVPPAMDAAGLLDAGRTLTEQLSGPAARQVTVTGGSYDYDKASLISPRSPGRRTPAPNCRSAICRPRVPICTTSTAMRRPTTHRRAPRPRSDCRRPPHRRSASGPAAG